MNTSSNEVANIQNSIKSIEVGKEIYTTGIGEGKQKIKAIVASTEMPASMMACSNCHGPCGLGITLQGVDIPDIRRSKYIVNNGLDQSVESIDRIINSKLKRTISMGLNFEGDKVHNMMPRYTMSLSDMNNLLSYLAVLGEDKNCKEK